LGLAAHASAQIPAQSDEADDSRVVAYAETERDSYRLDEEVLYRLIIAWKGETFEAKYRVPKPALGNLTLLRVTQKAEKQLTGSLITQKRILTYHLKPEKTGEASISGFSFEYTRPDRTDIQKTPIPGKDFQILPAKKTFWQIASKPLAAAGFLSALFIALALLFRRKKGPPPKKKLSISGLEDHYILELSRLEPLLTENKTRDLIAKSGTLFREYLQTKYQLLSQKFTNLELVEQIDRRRDIPQEERKQCNTILEYLNETQFAGLPPTKAEAERLFTQVNDFIIGKKVVG